MQRQGGKVQNLKGEPFGFIGAMDARKGTVRLDLHACHDQPPCHVVGYAPAIPILSYQSHAGRFAFLGRLGLFSRRGDTGQEPFLQPAQAQELDG